MQSVQGFKNLRTFFEFKLTLFEIICGSFKNATDVFKTGIALRKKKEMRIKKNCSTKIAY